MLAALALARSMSRSSTATSAPWAAKARTIAAPMVPPPPVTATTWPASGLALALPSLACSSDQYSISKVSASLMLSKRSMASAAAVTLTVVSAMSAAIAASLCERPTPNRPRPATITTRGMGSSMVFFGSAVALWRSK